MLSAPGDYTVRSVVSVTFQPDEDTQTVPVTINRDDIAELTEVFFGRLTTQPGDTAVILTQDTATVNIIDSIGESELVLYKFDICSKIIDTKIIGLSGNIKFELIVH